MKQRKQREMGRRLYTKKSRKFLLRWCIFAEGWSSHKKKRKGRKNPPRWSRITKEERHVRYVERSKRLEPHFIDDGC